MEVVGSIASIAQLASTVYSISKTLYEVGDALSNAPSDIKDLARDLETFSEELNLLSTLLDNKTSRYSDQVYRLTAKIIGDCATICVKIDRILRKLRSGSVMARIKWLYKEKEILKLLTRLRDLKLSLMGMLGMLSALKADHMMDSMGVQAPSLIEGQRDGVISKETIEDIEATRKKLESVKVGQDSESLVPSLTTQNSWASGDSSNATLMNDSMSSSKSSSRLGSRSSNPETKSMPNDGFSPFISTMALPGAGSLMQNREAMDSVQSFHSAVSFQVPENADPIQTNLQAVQSNQRIEISDTMASSNSKPDHDGWKAEMVLLTMKRLHMSKEDAEKMVGSISKHPLRTTSSGHQEPSNYESAPIRRQEHAPAAPTSAGQPLQFVPRSISLSSPMALPQYAPRSRPPPLPAMDSSLHRSGLPLPPPRFQSQMPRSQDSHWQSPWSISNEIRGSNFPLPNAPPSPLTLPSMPTQQQVDTSQQTENSPQYIDLDLDLSLDMDLDISHETDIDKDPFNLGAYPKFDVLKLTGEDDYSQPLASEEFEPAIEEQAAPTASQIDYLITGASENRGKSRRSSACLTCRKRFRRCGKERPACKVCRDSGRQCGGYDRTVVKEVLDDHSTSSVAYDSGTRLESGIMCSAPQSEKLDDDEDILPPFKRSRRGRNRPNLITGDRATSDQLGIGTRPDIATKTWEQEMTIHGAPVTRDPVSHSSLITVLGSPSSYHISFGQQIEEEGKQASESKRENQNDRFKNFEAEHHRNAMIKSQDDEIRRRPAVPLALTPRPQHRTLKSVTDNPMQWNIDAVLSWLVDNKFSNDWQNSFKALNICENVFLNLGRGRGYFGIMHQQIYPQLAKECTASGTGWDQAKEREEGRRLSRLIKRIVVSQDSDEVDHPPRPFMQIAATSRSDIAEESLSQPVLKIPRNEPASPQILDIDPETGYRLPSPGFGAHTASGPYQFQYSRAIPLPEQSLQTVIDPRRGPRPPEPSGHTSNFDWDSASMSTDEPLGSPENLKQESPRSTVDEGYGGNSSTWADVSFGETSYGCFNLYPRSPKGDPFTMVDGSTDAQEISKPANWLDDLARPSVEGLDRGIPKKMGKKIKRKSARSTLAWDEPSPDGSPAEYEESSQSVSKMPIPRPINADDLAVIPNHPPEAVPFLEPILVEKEPSEYDFRLLHLLDRHRGTKSDSEMSTGQLPGIVDSELDRLPNSGSPSKEAPASGLTDEYISGSGFPIEMPNVLHETKAPGQGLINLVSSKRPPRLLHAYPSGDFLHPSPHPSSEFPSSKQLTQVWWRAFSKLQLAKHGSTLKIRQAWDEARSPAISAEPELEVESDESLCQSAEKSFTIDFMDLKKRLSTLAGQAIDRIRDVVDIMRKTLKFKYGAIAWVSMFKALDLLKKAENATHLQILLPQFADIATLMARYNVLESMYQQWPNMSLDKAYEDSLIELCRHVLIYFETILTLHENPKKIMSLSDEILAMKEHADNLKTIDEADEKCRAFSVTIIEDPANNALKRSFEDVSDDSEDSDTTIVDGGRAAQGDDFVLVTKRVKV